MIWTAIAGGVFDLAKDYFVKKKQIAEVKHEVKLKQLTATQEWESKAIDGMAGSWKDEAWTICFIALILACFIPGAQPYIERGFLVLKTSTPEWIQYAILASIAASFGIKITERFQK